MIRVRSFVLHPFLFTLFPILSLYANNAGQEPFAYVIRSLAVGVAAAGLLLVLTRLALKNWHRAGLVVTLAALLFFSFGSIERLFRAPGGTVGHSGWLVGIWAGLLVAGELMIIRRVHGTPLAATRLLNLVGAAALITCGYAFASQGARALRPARVQPTASPLPAPKAAAPQLELLPSQAHVPFPVTGDPLPDVYYIILDGHARSDVLSEVFGVDNRPFIDFLKSRGFTVGTESHSNYAQTALSLASSLNMDYLDQNLALDPASDDRSPLTGLINDNEVQSFLKARGYTSYAFANGFPDTELRSADQFLQDSNALNGFELSLLSDTLGGAQLDAQMVDNYRQRILWQENEVENLVGQPGPKFVFAHFILPHPPFVFRLDDPSFLSLDSADGSQYKGSRADYQDGYRGQVIYADTLATKMIAYILDHSARDPIIILQSDHGSGMFLDWTSQANTCLRERFSILNAYHLPARYNLPGQNAAKMIYPSISPVNSFRVVLDAYFGTKLPLLPDRSFFSLWASPYDLNEVTGQFEKSCPRP